MTTATLRTSAALTPLMRAALKAAATGHLWRVRAGWIASPGGSISDGPFHAERTIKALIDRQLLHRGFDRARLTDRGRAVLAELEKLDA